MAPEVETEFEDDGELEPQHAPEYQGELEELDEELDEEEPDGSPASEEASPSTGPRSTGDYNVPSANREVWKTFGCDTEAGRALRKLYQGPLQKQSASKVEYPRLPSPSQRWEPRPLVKKPCPQKAPVRVPRRSAPAANPDDPKNWHFPAPGRRPAAEILAELEEALRAPERPNLAPGRDRDAEKVDLQDRFRYGGSRAMPPSAMGYVPNGAACDQGDLKKAAAGARAARQERRRIGLDGLNAEQREIFEELLEAVKRKQARIKEITTENAADPKPGKAKVLRDREATELRNDVDRDLRDIEKLLELTEGQAPQES